jgi:hypothetical protein
MHDMTRASPDQFSGANKFFLGMFYQMMESLSHGQTEFESSTYIFWGMKEMQRWVHEGGAQRPVLHARK